MEPATSPDDRSDALSARLVALQLLSHVLDKRTPLDQVLDSLSSFRLLSGRDRAFTRMLVATTLRRLGQIDSLIIQMSARGEAPSPPVVHHILRLGITQLFFMDVPVYAAVDTAVRMVEERKLPRLKGFVNAMMRRLDREGRPMVQDQDEVMLNIPAWLREFWGHDYGPDEADKISRAVLAEAPLDITIKDQTMVQYWAEQLEATIQPMGTLRRPSGGMVMDLPGYHDGMWWVQDLSASLPAKLLGPVHGKTVLDLCSAPGGKTAQLAAMGAHVIALDRSTGRLRRLDENMKRLRLSAHVEMVCADATEWKPTELVDFILLDAPCSATGTIRRHPDVIHLKHPQDINALSDVQMRLLGQAADMLNPGGILIYCTCSLQKSEGEHRIEEFLQHHSQMKRHPVLPQEVEGLEISLSHMGDLRILPHHNMAAGGMDGFYICRLQKR